VTGRFDADTSVRKSGDGLFEARIDPGWWVMMGPNGGYIAAVVLRALAGAVDDPSRAPRSLTLHYTAPPVEGPARIETRIERVGRSLTTVSGRLVQDGRLRALALAAFSRPRDSLAFAQTAMPEVRPPEQCPPLERMIPIHDRYEHRWAIGSPPFGGGDRALCGGWIRLAEPRVNDAFSVAAFADAFPPAVFSAVDDRTLAGGVPTVDLTIHFRTSFPLPGAAPVDWLLSVFRSQVARDGFVEETGEIWSRDGVLVAQSRQLALLT
jgi:acyl-CoA thioesterase